MTTYPRLNGRRGDRLGQVLRLFGSAYLKQSAAKLSRVQHMALRALVNCRTPAMGGHRQRCDRCGYEHHFYHSCRNRHCPQCQGPAQHRWLRARLEELLPVRCFHLVFTLPAELEPVTRAHRRAVYGLLLRAAADTVLTFRAQQPQDASGYPGGPAHLGPDTHASPPRSSNGYCRRAQSGC